MASSDKPIPDHVDRFLARYVQSIEYLEILVLVSQHPGRVVSADEVAHAIYTAPDSANRRLQKMAGDQLVKMTEEQPPRYTYAPSDEHLRELVADVVQTYRDRRVAVITAIASRPMDNVRAFSDAFRLGKKDKP